MGSLDTVAQDLLFTDDDTVLAAIDEFDQASGRCICLCLIMCVSVSVYVSVWLLST